MPNYVIVRNRDEKPMEYYRQKTKTFVGSLQSASKWNSKKMAQPAYDKLIKNGEKNLEIVDSDEIKITIQTDRWEDYAKRIAHADNKTFYQEVEKVASFLIASPLIVEEIRKEISQEDGVVLQDILHTVELGDYNKDEGLELLGDLRSSRQKRRNYKDKQEVMNMLLGGDENTGSQHAMDALDKIKEVTSPRSYQYRNLKLKQKYSKLLQSKQIKTIEKLIKRIWKLVK